MPGARKTKERIYRLVDQLPDREIPAAERYLQYLRDQGDPLLRKLVSVPYDDEPQTVAEQRSVEEAYSAVKAGDVRPLEEVEEELGL